MSRAGRVRSVGLSETGAARLLVSPRRPIAAASRGQDLNQYGEPVARLPGPSYQAGQLGDPNDRRSPAAVAHARSSIARGEWAVGALADGHMASGAVNGWAVLEDAETRLSASFAGFGVARIEYVVGFVEPYEVSVWLGTETDAQRETLRRREGLHEEVGDALAAAGIDHTDGVFRGVVVQSQETGDRDYDGNWFSALHRMAARGTATPSPAGEARLAEVTRQSRVGSSRPTLRERRPAASRRTSSGGRRGPLRGTAAPRTRNPWAP
jgi:hypothetical protein